MLELAVAVTVILLVYWSAPTVKLWMQDVEEEFAVMATKSAVDRIPELQALENELNKLGSVPDVKGLLARAKGQKVGKSTNPINTTEHS